ncbi:MAG TPA: DUF6069 family protein [Mycobacteriales bacterium]|jgi:hypothetical protein|nr:DUF6069 family protein [Mycobacteriales bacterium]
MTATLTTPATTTATRPALVVPGLVAVAAAAVATVAIALVARAAGVGFVSAGEAIPPAGFAVMTAMLALPGLVLAAALRRWAARPRRTFVRIAVTLTVLSLAAPFVLRTDAASVVVLMVTHVVAAAIIVPAVARRLS